MNFFLKLRKALAWWRFMTAAAEILIAATATAASFDVLPNSKSLLAVMIALGSLCSAIHRSAGKTMEHTT